MASTLDLKMGEVSLNGDSTTSKRVPLGKELLKHFSFGANYKNLNNGSFGAAPTVILNKQKEYQALCEAAPDIFMRYTTPKLIDLSRAALAKVLNTDVDTVVIVPNATSGVNTVLRNIVWNTDGKDEIIYFETIYGACGNTIEYVCEQSHYVVNSRKITLTYPLSDSALLDLFKEAIAASRAEGKRPRLALYDTISSIPGIRVPFEALTKICEEEGVLSLIDGAHGIGHIPINLTTLNPDFFISNVHKWLSTPRGCAVLFVPTRNQPLMRSTLPTSHGFVANSPSKKSRNPLPTGPHSEFINNFTFTGTIDITHYLIIPEVIKWREEVCGGEDAIMNYNIGLARAGGKIVANILGTEILDNEEKSLSNCALVNVRLPLEAASFDAGKTTAWVQETLIEEFDTFLPVFVFQGTYYTRMSAQVWLDESDFVWAGEKLKEICERASGVESLKAKVGEEQSGTLIGRVNGTQES